MVELALGKHNVLVIIIAIIGDVCLGILTDVTVTTTAFLEFVVITDVA